MRRRIPQLPLPPGTATFSEFGQLMKWGTGDSDARARAATVTAREMQDAQMTVAIALAWRMFYLGVIQETPKNPSASGRSELMGGIIELLEDN